MRSASFAPELLSPMAELPGQTSRSPRGSFPNLSSGTRHAPPHRDSCPDCPSAMPSYLVAPGRWVDVCRLSAQCLLLCLMPAKLAPQPEAVWFPLAVLPPKATASGRRL